jgi:hypothetical protein
MDWNKLPPGTLAIKLPEADSHEHTHQIMKDLFAVAKKYNIVVITHTTHRNKPVNIKFVTVEDYMKFVARYDICPNKAWYRFGQAFYNEMVGPVLRAPGMPEHSHPELFNCTDRKKAEQIIWDTYIVENDTNFKP